MNTNVKKTKPILYDPLIIPRVKQYLEDNVHQTYVDVAVMARQLQERYREYSRRKVGPFRMLVEQAYRTVLHSYGLDSNPSSDDNDGDANSDVEMMEGDNSAPNHLNNALTDMYSKNTQRSNDNELIDIISSDESADEGDKTASKTENNTAVSAGPKKVETASNLRLLVSKLTRNGTKGDPEPNKTVVAYFRPPQGTALQPANKKRRIDNGQQTAAAKTGGGDFVATTTIQPVSGGSAPVTRQKRYKKEVKAKSSFITFGDLGGLDRTLKELCELLFHMKHPEVYTHIGVDPPRGILLHGPPGCGKTLLAHAIAGQLNIPFIEVAATELIGGVSGESEERIREVFEQVSSFAPCVLFIDEIDAISSNRINAQKDMERRIVAQLISSLDSLAKVEQGQQILVIGATNRPEALDPALRRVGRFDHEISMGIPDRDEREEILIVICDGLCLETPMDFPKIAELTPGFVGADLVALTSRAASLAIKRAFTNLYRNKEAEATKNIPIVDLLDDTEIGKDAAEKDKENETKQNENKDNQNAEATSVKDGEETSTDPEKPEETNTTTIVVNDEDKAIETTDEAVADEVEKPIEIEETDEAIAETDEAIAETDEAIAETDEAIAEIDEATEIMETAESQPVDEPTVEDNAQETTDKPDVEATDAIDLDELPDEPEVAIKPAEKISRELTLFEMLNWIDGDSQSFSGNQLENICITLNDFINATKLVIPSAKREGFITVPDVTWDDIGSLRNIREELQLAVLAPVKFPEKLKALGLTAPSGVLLCGPPGCGKTLLAKAIANEAGVNFISVKGPELMNMYVGESERAVRQCFQRARNSQPCVIFFDEFDSLCPKRSDAADGGSATRVVNQLLTEMDGIEDRKGVFLMAATNRPDIIDPAVLRPGRLDTILYVGLPERQDRIEILEALTKKGTKPTLAEDVDLGKVADKTEGFTGADLSGLIRQASLLTLKESISGNEIADDDLTIHNKHFLHALSLVKPSVSVEDRKIYEKLRLKYAAPRSQDVHQ